MPAASTNPSVSLNLRSMASFIFLALTALSSVAQAVSVPDWAHGSPSWVDRGGHGQQSGVEHAWNLKKFSAFVVFGDSYSDDSRFGYFVSHNNTAPPVGWDNPPASMAADGGHPWPDYVAWYTGARRYNYAVSGAACSNDYVPRYYDASGIDPSYPSQGEYPDVKHYEVPAWIADSQYVEPDGGKFLNTPQDETVYSMWIGTNDLDVGGFLTDSQLPGTNITTYMDCVFDQLKRIHDHGGRYFILQNINPLFLTPLVATPENGGLGPNHLWPDKSGNYTAISYKMLDMVVGVNSIYEYRLPFEVVLQRRFPGAQFALMDMYGLVSEPFAPKFAKRLTFVTRF